MLKHLRSSVIIWSIIVLAMLIWASYEMLRPRVKKWMTPGEAVQVFSPVNVRSWFEGYSQKLKDLNQVYQTLYFQISGRPDSPELENLKKRKFDVEGQILVLKATQQTNLQSAGRMILNLLENGQLVAKVYDIKKGSLQSYL